jgi:hypothetical protein
MTLGPERRVLEIGAGAGLATKELTPRGGEVVALDPDGLAAGGWFEPVRTERWPWSIRQVCHTGSSAGVFMSIPRRQEDDR